MKGMATALLATALAASPAVAQQHGNAGTGAGIPMMGGMMSGPMAGAQHCGQGMGAGSPDAILRRADEMDLSAEQVARLETIREEARSETGSHMAAARSARSRAAELLAAEAPDLEEYRSALGEAADYHVEVRTAMARAAVASRGLLSADQRDRLSELNADLSGMAAHHGRAMGSPDGSMASGMACAGMMGGMMDGTDDGEGRPH